MVRTRFAPSPTGTPESIHLGFVIRALWNYAYAKKNHGQFIVRIEDTDQKRSRKDTEVEIFNILKKFNISWDETYRQSERLDRYKSAAHLLVEKDFAYYDFDAQIREKEEIKSAYSSKEKLAELKNRPPARKISYEESLKRVKAGEPYVVRAKIPEDKIFSYHDWILKKDIKFEGKEVPDMILLKSDGFPTYHLAVVVDDIDMRISHVFRGQEWISSTPIHLYIYEGLGQPIPEIGHFSVILDPRTGKKFSKRDLSAMFGVHTWVDQGYLPEALLNYLMLLGWAPKDNREFFTLEEFIQAFDQDGIQKANPVFNPQKLDWFNGQYLRQKNSQELLLLLKPFLPEAIKIMPDITIIKIIDLIKDRLVKLSDFPSLTNFLHTAPVVDISLFQDPASSIEHLKSILNHLSSIVNWDKESIEKGWVDQIKADGIKVGDYFMSLRIAICGSKFTPPITDVIEILGQDETTNRIVSIIKKLKISN